LQSVVTCLQVTQAKVALLQTQTRLLHDALERKNLRQHSELVLVQNPILKMMKMMMLIQTNNQCRSHLVSQLQIQVERKINFLFPSGSSDLGKKSGRTSIEHVSDMKRMSPFIIQITPNRSVPSVGLLQESSHSPALVQEQILICQHCQRVGHIEDQCFDLHPCEHCGKHNHHSKRCFKRKTTCKSKEPLWVDGFLVMVINSQEDMSVIPTNSLLSIDTSCSGEIFIFSPCP
jgi:hypothetical protein